MIESSHLHADYCCSFEMTHVYDIYVYGSEK